MKAMQGRNNFTVEIKPLPKMSRGHNTLSDSTPNPTPQGNVIRQVYVVVRYGEVSYI